MKIRMKKQYAYMVAYAFSGGFGNAQILLKKPLKNIRHIDWLHKFLAEQFPALSGIVVLNIIYFGREDRRKFETITASVRV